MGQKVVDFKLRGKAYSLTKDKVEESVKHAAPGEVDTYFVTIGGKKYPPKQVLSLALDVSPSDFISTDATRTLMKLGFEIHRNEKTGAITTTESEHLLESYLLSQGLTEFEFEPQLGDSAQRPDFHLYAGQNEILLEVKQFESTAADFRPGFGAYDPYGPIREKIDAGRRKFKEFKNYCCCLVLYNREKPLVHLGWQFVYGAMLGNMAFRVPFDPAHGMVSNQFERGFLGGGGKMVRYAKGTVPKPMEPQNSTISAVVVLQQMGVGKRRFDIAVKQREQELGRRLTFEEHFEAMNKARGTERDISLTQLRVVVCENPYARFPLPREIFRGPYDERYGVDEARQSHITRVFAGEGITGLESEEQPVRSAAQRIAEENRTEQGSATKDKPVK